MSFSFEDTKVAFAYKSDKELKNAAFLFSIINIRWLTNLGVKLTPYLLRWGFPIKRIIKNTLFKQFVGGETLGTTGFVVKNLERHNVQAILDYGVERKEGEENYRKATDMFLRVIDYAAGQDNIPYISIKVTGLVAIPILKKLTQVSPYGNIQRGILKTDILNDPEQKKWVAGVERIGNICSLAAEKKVRVLIDAEETWLQGAIDAVATQMMEKFNKEADIVYNTVQLYRRDRLNYLKNFYHYAKESGFIPAFKLVRGAYMEKEREIAAENGYPSPINPDKESTDQMYNDALEFSINPSHGMYVVLGSHNEKSNYLGAELIEKYNIPHNDRRIHFSQLYGMSDNITFNMARNGYNVSKYVPFGPINEVVPYLMRRAEENSSVNGQSSRELNLLKTEIRRRKKL